MTDVIGMIEIETDGLSAVDLEHPLSDATLDELFARLITPSQADSTESEGDDFPQNVVLAANFEALSDDLATVSRNVLSEIFLARGRR